MGVGRCLLAAGHRVLWASEGRSEATVKRAHEVGFTDAGSVADLAASSNVVLSICPPSAAVDVARQCQGFCGLYVDANAINPVTMDDVAAVLGEARVVDGGIIGLPPQPGGGTRLYLAGAHSKEAAGLFVGTDLEAVVMEGGVGTASALKMAYAGWTKGSMALLLTVRSLARSAGVQDELLAEWDHSLPGLAEQAERAEGTAAAKGWRWAGEMEEIAALLRAHDLPSGALDAAAKLYRRYPRL